MTLKRLEIQLTDPICGCEQQSLAWGMFLDSDKISVRIGGLKLSCKLCGVEVRFPYSGLKACPVFDNPYPDGAKQSEIELPDGTKIDADAFLAELEKQMQSSP